VAFLDDELKRFNAQVGDFTSKLVPEEVIRFQRRIVLELLRRVVLKTPVDTGRARGGWQTSIGKPAIGDSPPQKVAASVVVQANSVLKSLQPFQVVWLSNNVDYISYLEDGSSNQSPLGMVAISIQEILTLFR